MTMTPFRLIPFIILSLALALTACGGQRGTEDRAEESAAVEATPLPSAAEPELRELTLTPPVAPSPTLPPAIKTDDPDADTHPAPSAEVIATPAPKMAPTEGT